MKLIIYLIIYLFIGCKNPNYKFNNSTDEGIYKIDTITKNSEKVQLFDTLLIKKVRFNKKPFKLKHLYLQEKKIDSVVETLWECGNPFQWKGEVFDYNYVKGARYVTNQNDAFLDHAKFIGDNNLTFIDSQIIINKETTLKDFRVIFKNLKILEIEEGFAVYNITFNPSQPEDNWHFYFNKEGYIISFYLDWWLC